MVYVMQLQTYQAVYFDVLQLLLANIMSTYLFLFFEGNSESDK
jgi:hypothetical protein